MKANYIQPQTAAIRIELTANLLSGSITPQTIGTQSYDPADGPLMID